MNRRTRVVTTGEPPPPDAMAALLSVLGAGGTGGPRMPDEHTAAEIAAADPRGRSRVTISHMLNEKVRSGEITSRPFTVNGKSVRLFRVA